MPDLPSSLALTTIADGSAIIASTHRNNYTAVQTAVNAIKDALAGGVSGQVLRAVDSDTINWSYQGFTYRKTTEKDVANTVTETDLLNGEVTIGAGVLGTTGRLRATLTGDFLNNTGGNVTITAMRVKLGGTTLWDSGASGNMAASATRRPWRIQFDIQNLGAANSQFMHGIYTFQEASAPTTGIGRIDAGSNFYNFATNGTAAVDTSASCALVVSVQLASASTNYSFRLKSALVEVI